ncbi:MAG: SagB family peptide dehydrogenase [Chloroflexi bacterium]|nr:SagB family peptide dehydrogenase [Chloroflexota bacterium]
MKRLRQDLDHLTSAGLLVAAGVTAITGLIADLWDLNDFWYHTVSGYVMGALAIAHVLFNWRTLVSYLRFRLRGPARPEGRPSPRPVATLPAPLIAEPQPAPPMMAAAGRAVLSRRGLLGAGIGGAVGLALGRGLRQPPPIPAGSDVGVVYHEWSKPGIVDTLGTVANWGQSVPLYKRYPGAPVVALGEPDLAGGLSTAEAIVARRSARAYSTAALSLADLSRLLHLASGLSADRFGNARRTAPSSGALYPVEIYPVVHNVEGLERGVYHYAFEDHALELVTAGDFRQRVVEQGLMQEFLGQCGTVIFLTQILQRMRPKYQDRSYRYGLVEIGHIGQNVYLGATSMGLGACGIGAFMDDDINAMLGVDGVEEAAIYMLAVGRPAARADA